MKESSPEKREMLRALTERGTVVERSVSYTRQTRGFDFGFKIVPVHRFT